MNLFSSLNPSRAIGLSIVLLAILLATLATASRAIADDINPDADIPDASTLDSTPANPVLEIPQQCDQDSVAILCDKSSSDGSSSADADATSSPEGGGANVAINPSNDLPANAEVGSIYDYANQNITNDAQVRGMLNVPSGYNVPGGYYVPSYPAMAPAPAYVARGPGGYQQWASGPGTYQQWARGPGSFQQMAPGPGYIQPAPMAFHPYGLSGSFGAMRLGGGHLGHR